MTDGDDGIVRQLEDDFPGWYFWRARNRAGEKRSWMATRTDKSAGIEPTLMAPDAANLRVLLARQREAASNSPILS